VPFVKVGGAFIAMKGLSEDVTLADRAIKALGGKVVKDITYSIPPEDKRRIIVIEKASKTPKQYPRISGKIKSKPL
jgi:16S rRNA (guanine527-N7)-methyltransferase